MALTTYAKNQMLDTAATYFDILYLMNDGSNQIQVGDTISTRISMVRGIFKNVSWGTPNFGSILTTNGTTANAFLWAFAKDTVFNKIVFTDNNAIQTNRVIQGVIDIPTLKLPSFPVDGAYYIRDIEIDITEV